jgi:hypothetical protein
LLIQLTEKKDKDNELWVDPELVAAIKAVGEGQCAVFFAGQSALADGFLVRYPATEVAEVINAAIRQAYEDGGDEDDGEGEE